VERWSEVTYSFDSDFEIRNPTPKGFTPDGRTQVGKSQTRQGLPKKKKSE